MFLLPCTYSSAASGRTGEVVLQISAKQKLFGSNLYFGYSTQTFWPLYNRQNSSPVRGAFSEPDLCCPGIAAVGLGSQAAGGAQILKPVHIRDPALKQCRVVNGFTER